MIRYVITKPDGSPLLSSNGDILVMLTQVSARQTAKNLTFKTKTRHHTWSLTDDERYAFQKEIKKSGFVHFKI